MNFPPQLLGLFAGIAFLYAARLAATKRKAAWFFGWRDQSLVHAFLRMPLYASVFIGPALGWGIAAMSADFDNQLLWILTLAISIKIGLLASIYVRSLVRDKLTDADPESSLAIRAEAKLPHSIELG